MINTAPQGSNMVNGREKCFKTIILSGQLCRGRMAQWYEAALFKMEEVGMQGQILADFIFSFMVFLVFRLFSFILTADPL